MIFADITKAIAQLGDVRFRGVLGRSIALTLCVFLAVFTLAFQLLSWVDPARWDLPLIGQNTGAGEALGMMFSWGGLLIMLLFSVFLMIPTASLIVSLFLEDIADAVEDRHYPHLPPAPRVPMSDVIRDTVNFFAVMIGANLVALLFLPLYWFMAPLVFYAINGWLLGREYFTVVAMRREGRARASALRRQHRVSIWFTGCLMAVPLTIPLMNLLVPIIGAATFTHFYYRLAAR